MEIRQQALVTLGGKCPRDPPDTASAIARRLHVGPQLGGGRFALL